MYLTGTFLRSKSHLFSEKKLFLDDKKRITLQSEQILIHVFILVIRLNRPRSRIELIIELSVYIIFFPSKNK